MKNINDSKEQLDKSILFLTLSSYNICDICGGYNPGVGVRGYTYVTRVFTFMSQFSSHQESQTCYIYTYICTYECTYSGPGLSFSSFLSV